MFEVGDIIRFRYTGIQGEIVEDHLDGSYTILDNEDEEIIAFADDIVLDKQFKQVEESEIQKELKKPPKGLSTEEMFFSKEELNTKKNKHQQSISNKHHKENKAKEITYEFPQITPVAPTHSGCYLAFVPFSPTQYSIYIVNDTAHSYGFEFRLYLNQKLEYGFDKVIPAFDFFPIGEFLHEQFNDSPSIELNFPRLHYNKKVKLKYKKFAGTHKKIPLMGISTYGFSIFEKFPPKANTKESLKDYTQVYKEDKAEVFRPVNKFYRQLDLMEHASFDVELDLHAEKLVNDTSEFTAKELFELQLDVLDRFIQKAIQLHIDEVYIIHGVGKGRLKTAVANYLRYQDNVKSYKNEFHNKYGFGATIVRLD